MKDCRMCEYYHTIVCNHCDNQVTYSESPLINEIRADERRKICQMVKDNNGLIEGKDGMVVTTQEDFEYILAETESNAIRKFGEWLMKSKYIFVGRDGFTHDFHEKTVSLDDVLAEYEREKNI